MTETHTAKGATPPPFSLDDTTFSDDLLADIEALEPSQPKESDDTKDKDSQRHDASSHALTGNKGELAANGLVDLIEVSLKSFVVRDFTLSPERKTLIVDNFTPFFNKYDGTVVNLFGRYKEEAQAVFALSILAFSIWLCIKEAREQTQPDPEQGGSDTPTVNSTPSRRTKQTKDSAGNGDKQ
ncbi:hypothetical protein AT251_24670 [Enterovibrio nigricans]|nr:hypothetical protein [Enterovibrio nigricans]PKF48629.1 hypothetical protein AT251_24670 [Enterovibrio nigricans]